MLLFEFVRSLFALRFPSPAFDVLFQLPPALPLSCYNHLPWVVKDLSHPPSILPNSVNLIADTSYCFELTKCNL